MHEPPGGVAPDALPGAPQFGLFARSFVGVWDVAYRLLFDPSGDEVLHCRGLARTSWLMPPWSIAVRQQTSLAGTSYDTQSYFTFRPDDGRAQWCVTEGMNTNIWCLEGDYDANRPWVELQGRYPSAFTGVVAPCRVAFRITSPETLTYDNSLGTPGGEYHNLIHGEARRVQGAGS